MGGLLAYYHTIALKTHPEREVVVPGNLVVLQNEALCICSVAPLTRRKIIVAWIHAVHYFQTDGSGRHSHETYPSTKKHPTIPP